MKPPTILKSLLKKLKMFAMGKYLLGLLLLLPWLYCCEPNKEVSDFEKFTGRWTLHVVEAQLDSSAQWIPRQDHYRNRKGFIIYDGLGGMGVHHVTEDYETYIVEGKGGLDSLTVKDLRHLANNFVYFGKYKVIDSLKIVEHHIESADMPRRWGTIEKRSYTFSGDTLTLYPMTKSYPKNRLKWVRLKDIP